VLLQILMAFKLNIEFREQLEHVHAKTSACLRLDNRAIIEFSTFFKLTLLTSRALNNVKSISEQNKQPCKWKEFRGDGSIAGHRMLKASNYSDS
jgi:hypothetical protein